MSKKSEFNIVKTVKENSRLQIGMVPSTSVIQHKHKRDSKHPKRELERARYE